MKNEIVRLEAAYLGFTVNADWSHDYFKKIGIKTEDPKRIVKAINQKKTKLALFKGKNSKKGEQESFNFYKLLAKVQLSAQFQINIETTSLAEWCAIIVELGDMAKAQKDMLNKSKKGKK